MIRILLFLGLCAIIEESYGDKNAIKYLMQYGYLESPEVGAFQNSFSYDEYESALKMAQKFAGIPATGKLDHQTRVMLGAPRCGVPDTGSRLKRFGTGSKWPTKYISYSLSNWSPRLTRNELSEEMRKAFDTWAKYSKLVFTETQNPREADIKIGFYRGHHGDNNPFDGEGNVLAHAFFPSDGLGGDIHFDDDEKWAINLGHFEDRVYFSAVALHELGHSLGLSHSPKEGSIMNPFYKGKMELGYNDILAIHKLYIPEKKPEYPVEHPHCPHYPDYPDHPHYPDDPKFDGCTGGYDTVAYFRGEFFVIKNQSLWRLTEPGKVQSGYPVDMHRFFYELPSYVKNIDAIYERTDDSSMMIFSGKQYWIFDGYNFIENSPRLITDYGLPESEDKVDAVMVGIDSKVYVFRGDKVWRFNQAKKTFESKIPISISTFRGIPDNLDAALTYKNETYFIKGNEFWTYNIEKDYAEKKYGGTASNYWLSC